MAVLCAGCERPIMERFLLNVLDRVWHTGCVQCFDCKDTLTEKCFSRDGKLFCRLDFIRRFGSKCDGCTSEISPQDLVRRVRSRVYHLPCFLCYVCRKSFDTGEELHMLDDNRLMCKNDYAKLKGTDEDDKPTQQLTQSSDIGRGTHSFTCDTHSLTHSFGIGRDTHSSIRDIHSLTTHPLAHSSGIVRDTHSSTRDTHSLTTHPLAHSSDIVRDSDTDLTIPTLREIPVDCSLDSDESEDDDDGDISCDLNDKDTPTDNNSKNTDNNSKDSGNISKDTFSSSKVDSMDNSTGAGPRRGPRTTIKAKQLETLKAAFAATPKPTRRIREELAQESGLSMRVIQVWFQNRRSKERRMKQLRTFDPQREFFLNNCHMRRPLRPMEDNQAELGPHGFGSYYASENSVKMLPWSVNGEDPSSMQYPRPLYHEPYASKSICGGTIYDAY